MENYKTIKILDKLSFIYEKFGVDYDIMRKILKIKLIMDERRVPTVLSSGRSVKERSGFINLLYAYGFPGLFIMLFVFLKLPILVKMNFIFGMIIFMIMATMISDFSSVLLDIKDKDIMLSKPIDSKTINAAKLTHIFIYLFQITIIISGPSLIVLLIKYGFVPFIIFFIELFFIAGFVMFFTSIFYFIILLFFDGEKLKDIINYFQIILSIAILISSQLIGRMFDLSKLNIVINPKWWHYLVPSNWFAAPVSYFLSNNYREYYIYLSCLGIVIPIITFVIYFRIIIPFFEKNLEKLNDKSMKKNRNIGLREKIYKAFLKIICRENIEKSFFRFTQKMISNERKLKLKIYPNLAYACVVPFIFIFSMLRDNSSMGEVFSRLSNGEYYLSIYAVFAMLVPSITMLSRSENYNGAWIYRVLPIETPIPIFKGLLKGFMMKCILPVQIFISVIFLIICGLRILPDIILIFLNMIFLSILVINQSKKLLPFSMDFEITRDNNTGLIFLEMLLCGALAGAHAFLKSYRFGIAIYILITLISIMILWKNTFKISWSQVLND